MSNSGIGCYVSTLRWQYTYPYDRRPWVAPDIPAELSAAGYRVNRDPALEAILAIPPGTLNGAPYPDRVILAIKAGNQA